MKRYNYDIVLINPGNRQQIFQTLGLKAAAVEPPFWIAVIAAYLRSKGFKVSIIDANAENISPAETAAKTKAMNPILATVIVYGSQPSASTQNMTSAGKICYELKQQQLTVAIGGLHPSALPEQTLREEAVDFVIDGEGILTLENLLPQLISKRNDFHEIGGLWWKEGNKFSHTKRYSVINDLDRFLSVGAWDLLPMEKYRAHNWHCFDDIEHRQPYGAIYTSLGCPFNCAFCCINAPFGKPGIRYRNPDIVLDEMELLVREYGVKNLKIVDELFVLKKDHYMAICQGIIDRRLDLNIWAYARIDTVQLENLKTMKKAGINWLALGIESANPDIRDGAQKKLHVNEIKEVVRTIQASGIRVIGNYIFGLPNDNMTTMRETLDMAKNLNCEFANFYSAMAYPGSRLYNAAVAESLELPSKWEDFSQHSYGALPLSNKYVSSAEILRFRDNAFHEYYENPSYLNMIQNKFGLKVRLHIEEITKIKLKRKILGD